MIRKRVGFGNDDYVYKTITLFKKKHLYEYVWFSIAVVVLGVLLVLAIMKLNTRNINKKRLELQRRVDEQTAELSKTVEVRELMMNIISHDMSSPIRHIGFIANILARGLEKDPEQVNSALLNIKTTSENILTNTQRIINLMHYNKQQMDVNIHEVSLYELADESIELYAASAKSKEITINNKIDKLAFAKVDFTILGIILNNVVSNAVKYSSKGNINISSEKTIEKEQTIIKVSDEGWGITKEMLGVIREVLEGRIEAIKTTTKLNTGLGYVLIAELMKIHGGLSIAVDSIVEKGTTVSIIISQ